MGEYYHGHPGEYRGQYPEHEKLWEVVNEASTVADFLAWLAEHGWRIVPAAPTVLSQDRERRPGDAELMAQFFKLDQDKLRAEQAAMYGSRPWDMVDLRKKKVRRAR